MKTRSAQRTLTPVVLLCLSLCLVVFSSAKGWALTEEQKTEQRRQQQAAQRAYEASAESYDDAYNSGQEMKQDLKQGAKQMIKGGLRMR